MRVRSDINLNLPFEAGLKSGLLEYVEGLRDYLFNAGLCLCGSGLLYLALQFAHTFAIGASLVLGLGIIYGGMRRSLDFWHRREFHDVLQGSLNFLRPIVIHKSELFSQLEPNPKFALDEFINLRANLIKHFTILGVSSPDKLTDEVFATVMTRMHAGEKITAKNSSFVIYRIARELAIKHLRARTEGLLEEERAAIKKVLGQLDREAFMPRRGATELERQIELEKQKIVFSKRPDVGKGRQKPKGRNT